MTEDFKPRRPGLLRLITRTGLQLVLGAALLGMGLVALLLPLLQHYSTVFLLGLLVLGGGLLEVAQAYVTLDGRRRRLALGSAAWAVVTGVLLLAAGDLAFSALAVLLGLSWLIDGLRTLGHLPYNPSKRSRLAILFDGAVGVIIGLAIAIQWPLAGAWTVYIAAGLRLLAAGWTILLGRDTRSPATDDPASSPQDAEAVHPDEHLGLPPSPAIAELRRAWDDRERHRRPVDLYWVLTLLLTFFAIHTSRMQADWTLAGLASPAVAVAGDIFFALVIAFVVVVPLHMTWRFLTRPIERRLWTARLRSADAPRRTRSRLLRDLTEAWLRRRLGFALRLDQMRVSPAWGLRRGLQIGLPPTAVLVAIAPLLGVSWYFNTETWPTGLWDHWAAYRTDDWRTAMTQAAARNVATTQPFTLPALAPRNEDFAFIVIGDTGEGDASQHILRDQFLALGARDEVKFLVLSSDVIYPQGAMKDYEEKFYLPFKGFAKPIVAIPGNHDWYDALEAFAANFFDAASARAALLARLEADHRISTTTESTIESLLQQAAALRQHYGVKTGLQRGPYFELQTDRFALIAVDTGIVRSIDPMQLDWLKQALQRAQGKTIMVIAGHPMYAAGHRVASPGDDHDALHQLLREHGVHVTMAGDTHDFEVYRERYSIPSAPNGPAPDKTSPNGPPPNVSPNAPSPGGPTSGGPAQPPREMLHFVNGGGGAYLSIGTALDFPATPPTEDWAFYPSRRAVVDKLSAELPSWKKPLWWWTLKFHGWPASSEVLASAFASNRAPFYQSFALIRVEPSQNRLRVQPYNAHGRIRWRDLAAGGAFVTDPAIAEQDVEFVVPMTPATGPATLPGDSVRP